jgi:hypothetical protein
MWRCGFDPTALAGCIATSAPPVGAKVLIYTRTHTRALHDCFPKLSFDRRLLFLCVWVFSSVMLPYTSAVRVVAAVVPFITIATPLPPLTCCAVRRSGGARCCCCSIHYHCHPSSHAAGAEMTLHLFFHSFPSHAALCGGAGKHVQETRLSLCGTVVDVGPGAGWSPELHRFRRHAPFRQTVLHLWVALHRRKRLPRDILFLVVRHAFFLLCRGCGRVVTWWRGGIVA